MYTKKQLYTGIRRDHLAITQAVRDSRGYTTDAFGRCAICREPITEGHGTCNCGAIIVPVRFHPKQQQLLNYALDEGIGVPTKLGYGGSRASGKSRGGRDIALTVASEVSQKYPGIPVFIMRRNWTQCKENHLEKLKLERPLLTRYYGDKQYEFPAQMGSPRLVFTYADTPEDIIRVGRGPECYLMIIDQAEQLSEADLQELNTPNRWPDAGTNAAKTIYLFNPGGPGSSYLKRVFFTRNYDLEREDPRDFAFIQAYGWDNASWFLNQGIEINGKPLTWESFYELPGDLPPCESGNYNRAWLHSLPEYHRFRLFVEQTSEGRKMWGKPESIRMGDLFGRFDEFSGQYMAGAWNHARVAI